MAEERFCVAAGCSLAGTPASGAFCSACGAALHSTRPVAPTERVEQPASVLSTVLVTFFFGLFGLIPAIGNSNRERDRGRPTSRYWKAFGGSLLASVIVSIGIVVTLVVTVSNAERNDYALTRPESTAGGAVNPGGPVVPDGLTTSDGPVASGGPVVPDYDGGSTSASATSYDVTLAANGIVFAGASTTFGDTCEHANSTISAELGLPATSSISGVTNYTWDDFLIIYCPGDVFRGWTYYSLSSDPSAGEPTGRTVGTADSLAIGDSGSGLSATDTVPSQDGSLNYETIESGITYLVQNSDDQIHGFEAGTFK